MADLTEWSDCQFFGAEFFFEPRFLCAIFLEFFTYRVLFCAELFSYLCRFFQFEFFCAEFFVTSFVCAQFLLFGAEFFLPNFLAEFFGGVGFARSLT